MNACIHARLLQLCLTLWDPMNHSPPGSSVHRILQQEYWSGQSFPSPGDLSDPGIKPMSPTLAGRFFTTSATWEAPWNVYHDVKIKEKKVLKTVFSIKYFHRKKSFGQSRIKQTLFTAFCIFNRGLIFLTVFKNIIAWKCTICT